jgi:invasion protein IalB
MCFNDTWPLGVPAILSAALVLAATPPAQALAAAGQQPPGAAQKQPAEPKQQAFVGQAAWRTVCSAEAGEKWRCRMERSVPAPDRKGVLMQMVITRSSGDKARAEFLVPLAVYLPAGVEFTPEKAKPLKVAYTTCSPTGCVAPFAIDDALVAQLKSGSKLEIRFVMRDQSPVGVAVDLKGFAEAYDKLVQKP